jgi:flagellar hook-length control protein FliK
MAGAQGATQPQPAAARMAGNSDQEGSTESVSGTSGGSRGSAGSGRFATQAIIAGLENGAGDLQATVGTADGAQSNAPTATDPAGTATPDGANAAAIAFQSHMAVSSHFQQPAPAVNATKVESPVGTPGFNDELGGKITWLANQGVQSASLQLAPEHLGPVSVHISVQDGSATVSFNAAHADTRTALEQALPRLREMFSTQGLTLTDASVSHQSPRGQPQKQAISSINAIGGVGDDSNATSITSVASARLGLVDTYA